MGHENSFGKFSINPRSTCYRHPPSESPLTPAANVVKNCELPIRENPIVSSAPTQLLTLVHQVGPWEAPVIKCYHFFQGGLQRQDHQIQHHALNTERDCFVADKRQAI